MSDLGRAARRVFDSVVADCDPSAAFHRAVSAEPGAWMIQGERLELAGFRDVRVLAIGKPALALASACSTVLDAAQVPRDLRRGVAVVPAADVVSAAAFGDWLEAVPGGHPLPDASSFRAGRILLDQCSEPADSRSILIALVGGGGSAMAEWPAHEGATPEDLAELNEMLVRSDLSIREINAIRKRVSAIKGGRLAIAASPARVMTFVVSDVACGDVCSVASGPTVEDDSSIDEALDAITRLEGLAAASPCVVRMLEPGSLAEPPQWSDGDRGRARALVLLDAARAAELAEAHAAGVADIVRGLGVVDGPAETVARAHVEALERLAATNPGATCAVVSAGEATVDVRSSGSGGRNQHLALSMLVEIRRIRDRFSDFALLCAGTDGIDGNTAAAGALVEPRLLDFDDTRGQLAERALSAFDSGGYFGRFGAQVVCGPTGTNVRDLRVLLGVGR